MANLIRSAKSGSDWTQNDLRSYNITVVYQDAPTFFNMPILPQPVVHPEILTTLIADDMIDDNNHRLLRYMDLAMNPVPAEESAVDDFAAHLLTTLGYVSRDRLIRTRKDLPLFICGEKRNAQTDVCILNSQDILLLVQEYKHHMLRDDPEPELIAEAIATFQTNNTTRRRTLALPPLHSKTIAGIALTGTAPIFYKIPVTAELVVSVEMGTYPTVPVVVAAHIPDLPRAAHRYSEGMKPLDNRAHILACYEAFKQFVN